MRRTCERARSIEIDMFDFLMLSGRAVLCPIYKGTYDRKTDESAEDARSGAHMTRPLYQPSRADTIPTFAAALSISTRVPTFRRPGSDTTASAGAPPMVRLRSRWSRASRPALFLSGGFQPYREPPEVDPLQFRATRESSGPDAEWRERHHVSSASNRSVCLTCWERLPETSDTCCTREAMEYSASDGAR